MSDLGAIERGDVVLMRNLIHGAPVRPGYTAARLRRIDEKLKALMARTAYPWPELKPLEHYHELLSRFPQAESSHAKAKRVVYLEACLRDAGFWETDVGWHNGERFIGLGAREAQPSP